MIDLVSTIRSIVRHELAGLRMPELGIVTEVFPKDSGDSDGNHQVNVRLQSSGVVLQRAAVAVSRIGLSVLPRVDDLVVVAFLAGDLNAPVIVGAVYDDRNHPPEAQKLDVVYEVPDQQSAEVRRVHLKLPSGQSLTADDDAFTLECGSTTVKVNRNGDVNVTAKAKIVLEADGNIELSARGDLDLSAVGNVTIKGVAATLEGQATATLKGPQVSLAGNTMFSPQ